MPIDVQRCAAVVLEQGFCILRGQFPAAVIREFREAFAPLLREYAAANADGPNRGPARHYIPLPLRPPFSDRRVLFDPDVLAISRKLLGQDMTFAQYATDTPSKGSTHQDVHCDLPPLFPEEPDLWHPPHVLAVNFSFVPVTPENGPFEVARGSHRLPREVTLRRINAGELPLEPVYLDVGDVMIRDPRCLHRGTPNQTDEPRPVAVIGYERSWVYRPHLDENPIPRETWETLNEEERRLMRKMPRKD